jgi:hypothetical protein
MKRYWIGLFFMLVAFMPIHATPRRSSAPRPYYGGGKHTTSHGGQYSGATSSHHKNGHYNNWRTSNHYGVHKP